MGYVVPRLDEHGKQRRRPAPSGTPAGVYMITPGGRNALAHALDSGSLDKAKAS